MKYLPNMVNFRIPHNTLCLPPQILHKLLFSNALGDTAYSQEHLKTMVYAKFVGQTKCIMGNSKIENLARKSGNFGLRSNGKAIYRKIYKNLVLSTELIM